ncbi:unnamed protein product [Prorocentrum cordatum]|uniref:Uncharacterized protein n=1 Tax=Prorocentrum cordatum TaxID=2364126 RepID=A0ABN9VZ60_9DINO|nr:unnamed protein product [Polarella glacialis]
MDDEELDELYEDVVDRLQRSLADPGVQPRLRERLRACARAMREGGDSYCRELWEQEDRGERRRRREEDTSSDEGSPSRSRSGAGSAARRACAEQGRGGAGSTSSTRSASSASGGDGGPRGARGAGAAGAEGGRPPAAKRPRACEGPFQ